MKKNTVVVAVLGGVLSMGVVGASAATLGGLTGSGLGADDQIVAACDTDGITVAYATAYSAVSQVYQVTAVNAACTAKAASVSLRNGATNLGTTNVASITVTASAFSVTLASPVTASSVNGLSLVISG